MESTVEQKLQALYNLQSIHTKVDKIHIVRGELPMEVIDLEDEITGLNTRESKFKEEIENLEIEIANKKTGIKDSTALIKKYDTQLKNVKNNREYEVLNKEIEIQGLDIQVYEKRIKEYTFEIKSKATLLEETEETIKQLKKDLKAKQAELDTIIAETEKEENDLLNLAKKAEKTIESRLIFAYSRLRKNAKNGLAVVCIQRNACGGCFNSIPPQMQADIRQRKKIIVCEHCGRIVVDEAFAENDKLQKA